VESDKLRGAYIDPSSTVTVAEYAERWVAARPYRPTTRRRVCSQLRHHLTETRLGQTRLAAVLPSDVQAWAAERSRTLAPATVRLMANMLKSIFAGAVLDRLIPSSPVVRVALPRVDRSRVVPLRVEQVQALADAVPDRNRAMVIAQAGLGLRLGELLAVRQRDVDFLRRAVRVEHQLAERTRERVEPKTATSRRTVPLPALVAEELAAHIQAFPPLEDGTLFYGWNGRPYDHAVYGKIIKRAVRRLADVDPTFPADSSTHSLRHHYASVLLAAGESVVCVAERLGHDNATMVITTYGHLMPDSEDRTRRAVDEAWRSAADQARTGESR
jgi:integrase